jgi:23S rRNA (cytidine2498-2'-O)-methyltransferase
MGINFPQIKMNKKCAYLAPKDYIQDVKLEIARYPELQISETFNNLFLADGDWRAISMSQASWKSCQEINFQSISDGAKKLGEIEKFWHHLPINNFRRAELIGEQLRLLKTKNYNFLDPVFDKTYGVYGLKDEKTLIVLTQPTHPLPTGEVQFNEDKINPPSRAYLKLWELFTVYGIKPTAGQKTLDMGSCPGGWTWVLQTIGAHVISVDKAPLEDRIAKLPNIVFRQESAFGLRPQHVGEIDWFFSDIICYPQKLYELVERWIKSGLCKRFVCTIKFQKEAEFEILQRFLQLAPSRIIHLHHNKHEVTWVADLTSASPH